MRKRKIVFWAILLSLIFSVHAGAAGRTDGWHRAANGKAYFYKNGKMAKGFVRIKNKTCYFDKNGKLAKNRWILYRGKKYRADKYGTIKRNCFIKVDGKFYSLKADGSVRKSWQKFSYGTSYFGADGAIRKGVQVIGKKTYLFSSRGILLKGIQKQGNTTYFLSDKGVIEAKVVSSKGRTICYDGQGKRLDAVKSQDYETQLTARRIVSEITSGQMSREQKLKACFDWVIAKPYVTRRKFSNFDGWPAVYANDHFRLGGGNCQSDAAAFAYMAKALGYSEVYVCTDSDGSWGLAHSWAEVEGRVFDPLFAEAKGYYKYYNIPYQSYELRPILHIKI